MKRRRKRGRPVRCFICGEVIGFDDGGLVIDAMFHNAIHHPAAFHNAKGRG